MRCEASKAHAHSASGCDRMCFRTRLPKPWTSLILFLHIGLLFLVRFVFFFILDQGNLPYEKVPCSEYRWRRTYLLQMDLLDHLTCATTFVVAGFDNFLSFLVRWLYEIYCSPRLPPVQCTPLTLYENCIYLYAFKSEHMLFVSSILHSFGP